MKSIYLLLIVVLCAAHCDPKMNCTDPECGSSPIEFAINASINDTSSILSLGDTLKMYVKIPDTIQSNYGEFIIESIEEYTSYFFLEYHRVDSIYIDRVEGENLTKSIKFAKGGFKGKGLSIYFDKSEKITELFFIPTQKGKYYIASIPQSTRFIFKPKDESELLAMLTVGLDIENHDLYLSWISNLEQRVAMSHELADRKRRGLFWYAFEVK